MTLKLAFHRARTFRRSAVPILVAVAGAGWVNGCGSGSSSPSSSTLSGASKNTATGRVAFRFTWPKRAAMARLIPVAANSIQISVASAGTVVATQLMLRPSTGSGPVTATFSSLNVGTYIITTTAFPDGDGSGIAQATAQVSAKISQNKTTQIAVTMASTIATLSVTPQITSLYAGHMISFVATPMDAQGNIVLTSPSTLQWTSSAQSVATVDATGKVTGVTAGSVLITATETESGKTASIALSVAAAALAYNPNQAVAYQINPSHSGIVAFGQPLNFPSSPTWSVDLGGKVSYPLIADGKVFVTIANPTGGQGTELLALDEATGRTVWGPVGLGGYYPWSGIAYDNGKVFAINGDGLLQEFDGATGTPGWVNAIPSGGLFDAPPTAVNGMIYVGDSGVLSAVDEAAGVTLWSASVEGGDESSPALSPDGVFVSYPCQVYKFDSKAGAPVWHYNGPCEGGGGKTAAYANGQLYVRDQGGTIYDASTGSQIGAFNSGPIPALGATNGFFLSGGALQGINLTSRQAIWSFTGDGTLNSAPIVIDQTVIVGSATGNVYALDAATGSQIWSGFAGAAINAPDEQNVSQPLTGFGAGEGYLVTPAGTHVVAWKIAGQ